MYLYDHNEALRAREENVFNAGLDRNVLESLQHMMNVVSPYVHAFRKMRDVVAANDPEQMGARIVTAPGTDMRRYNRPP